VLNALSAAVLGFLLGLRHATDADHVVAVTAIVSRERSFARAARIGALWGIGHSLTVMVIGGAIVVFRIAIPARLGLGLEFAVAVVLILLGFANLRRQTVAGGEMTDAAPTVGGRLTAAGGWRPLGVGVVHGLAGSAAVALLVLAAIPETVWALAYLGVFGLGTIVGMTVVTWLIAAPAVYAANRVGRFQRGIRLAAGTLSLLFGLFLARAIIVNGGLFRDTPSWTPR
jgi:high-affinity nickel-transport protein